MNIKPFTKQYDGTLVLNCPGLELQPGTIYGIIGANGSGKSTFAKILAGVLPADKKGPHIDAASVGYMPQKSYAFRMTVKNNLLLGAREELRAEALMDALQIRHLQNKRADKLSGGETARMALARLMMRRYDLVILDEPTAAMDIETTMLAEQQILAYVRETGCALILVTHSLQQAKRIADEILFFRKGELLESGAKEDVLYAPSHQETKRFLEFYGT